MGRRVSTCPCSGFLSPWAGAGAPRYSKPGEWEYVDPKGVIQGPFSSKEVLKWADAGFFTPDQQV